VTRAQYSILHVTQGRSVWQLRGDTWGWGDIPGGVTTEEGDSRGGVMSVWRGDRWDCDSRGGVTSVEQWQQKRGLTIEEGGDALIRMRAGKEDSDVHILVLCLNYCSFTSLYLSPQNAPFLLAIYPDFSFNAD